MTFWNFILPYLIIVGLSFVQNVSFSMVSRSRNRDNINYHIIASFFSNTLWFLTLRQLVLAELTVWLFIPYAIGTVTGSVFGVKISMRIEKWLGATADGHIVKESSKLKKE